MKNEEKQQIKNNPEVANLVKELGLVPVPESQPHVIAQSMNIGPYVRFCEAVRRVFPSKEKLTLSRIKHFLSVEGFVPMENGEGSICFKIQGEPFGISYDGLRLCFNKSYVLPAEGLSLKAMMAANGKVASDIYGVKSCLGKDEDGCNLCFTAESICSTYSDFTRQYYYYMGAIDQCVNYHRKAYGAFLEQFPVGCDEDKPKRRKIGF